MYRILLMFGFAGMIPATAVAQAQEGGGGVAGAVVAAATGAPVENADVFIAGTNRHALTDRAGHFRLAGLGAGAYELVVERIGYAAARVEVTVSSGTVAEVSIQLQEQAISIPEMMVTASRDAKALSEIAASVGVIGREAIAETHAGHPSEIMGRVPGVWVNVTGGEGHMMAIRQPLSTSPVYLYLEDGVPTRSTGFFNHNALYEVNLPQAERIEVMKGPANALYGSDAIGGVINVGTRAPSPETTAELSVEGGEFGFQRYLGSVSGTGRAGGLRADVNFTRTDGWREGTAYDRWAGTLRWDASVSGSTSLKTVVAYSTIDQKTAGSSAISRGDFEANPTVNYTPISFRKVTALRVSTALEHLRGNWLVSLTPFVRSNTMDLLPNWSLTYDPTVYETENSSVGFLGQARYYVPDRDLSVTLGFDADYSPGGQEEWSIVPEREGTIFTDYHDGEVRYDYDVTFRSLSPYLHVEFSPTDRVHASAGLRADFMGYDYTNALGELQTGRWRRPADASPNFSAVSPKFGLSFEATDDVDLFVSYRRGFRAPSQSQLFRQGSAESTVDLEPVKVNSYEAGVRGRAGERLTYEASAYYMQVTDDILGFQLPDGSSESRNAGETLHKGVELGLGLGIVDGVTLDVSYSVAEHTYEVWRPSETVDLSGHEMNAAPQQIGNAVLNVAPRATPGARFALEWSRVGEYWEDQSNENDYEGHDLLSLRLSYELWSRFTVFARVNNLADVRYAESAGYNAFRGEELAPGLPRTLYLGVSVR